MSSGRRERVERRLAALLAADVAGYSRLTAHQAAGCQHASAGNRSDGGLEAQPRTGSACKGRRGNKERRTRALANRRQPPLLLPVSGGQKRNAQPATEPTAIATRRRKKG